MESICDGLNAISVQIQRDDAEEDEDEEYQQHEKERQIELKDNLQALLHFHLSDDEAHDDEENVSEENLHVRSSAALQTPGKPFALVEIDSAENFQRGLQRRNLISKGKATSTPFAPSQRPLSTSLRPQSLTPLALDLTRFDANRFATSAHNVSNETDKATRKQKQGEMLRNAQFDSGHVYGVRAGGDCFHPHFDGSAQGAFSPYHLVTNHTQDDTKKLIDVQSRQIGQLKEEMRNSCTSLEEELSFFRTHMTDLTNENGGLREENEKLQQQLGEIQYDSANAKSLVKSLRMDLDQAKEEKQDLLKKLYINESMIKQLNSQLAEMTSWRTVDQLKSQHEGNILQMKEVHAKELRTIEERLTDLALEKDRSVQMVKRELESLQDQLTLSKERSRQLQDNILQLENKLASKNSILDVERRQEEQTQRILQLKAEEIMQYEKKTRELEELLENAKRKSADEIGKIMDEMAKVTQNNARLNDERARAVEEVNRLRLELSGHSDEALKNRGELTKAMEEMSRLQLKMRSQQADLMNARMENEDIKRQLQESIADKTNTEDMARSLQSDVAKLQKELLAAQRSSTEAARGTAFQRTIELLERQLKLKEEEVKSSKEKLHQVQDRLHSQLQKAADDNTELREEKIRLDSEIHNMKKVIKKLKKYVADNPSPSGDSGIDDFTKDAVKRWMGLKNGEETSCAAGNTNGFSQLRENMMEIISNYRRQIEEKCREQLEEDRREIIRQVDVIYTHKLQEALLRIHKD